MVFDTLRVDMLLNDMVQIEFIVVQRKTLTQAKSILAQINLVADIIDLDSGDRLAPPKYDFDRAQHAPQLPNYVFAGAGFALVAAFVFGSALGINLRAGYNILNQEQAYVNSLEERLVDLTTLNTRVQAIYEEERFVRELRFGRPSTLAAIESLSRVLPDGSWLESLTLTDENLTISGFARDANRLPALIEAAPIFEAVRFKSASERTIIEIRSGEIIEAERFTLQMILRFAIEPEI